jgi:toxin-antitoxin system PIN domain toxin
LIAIDSNILIYAHREESPFHAAALACMVELAESRAAWAIPWPCVHEFLAIVTNPRVYTPPSPLAVALDAMDAWLRSPSAVLLAEGPTHWPTLRRMLVAGQIAGGRVHDARIAALCIQHGVRELWSSDRDFSRFPDLATANPIVAARN